MERKALISVGTSAHCPYTHRRGKGRGDGDGMHGMGEMDSKQDMKQETEEGLDSTTCSIRA